MSGRAPQHVEGIPLSSVSQHHAAVCCSPLSVWGGEERERNLRRVVEMSEEEELPVRNNTIHHPYLILQVMKSWVVGKV